MIKKTRLVRLSVELIRKIEEDKPDWMSYDRYLLDMFTLPGDQAVGSRRMADFDLTTMAINDERVVELSDLDEIARFKTHLKYIKRKHGLDLRFKSDIKNGRYQITVKRLD